MMPRARKHDPSIPAHIDQKAIPAGVYWDRSGKGRWYRLVSKDGKPGRQTLATAAAKLSDLHALMEGEAVGRGTVAWTLDQFHASTRFAGLVEGTRKDYETTRKAVVGFALKNGQRFGQLAFTAVGTVLVQRIVEKVAKGGHPTKANKFIRYLRRAWKWGGAHLGLKTNPARGVEAVKERQRRRLPAEAVYASVRDFARARGAYKPHTKGSVAPYLWLMMEVGYLCRLRGIETNTVTDAHLTGDSLLTERRKGSRDNEVEFNARLESVLAEAKALRDAERKGKPTPLRPEDRRLFVGQSGEPLAKSSVDTAWQRLMKLAVKEGVIAESERFGLHDLKRKGGTDTPGNRAEKQDALGVSEAMMKVYDHSRPKVKPSA